MFDFRYHVASLIAVFLALVIGILVGVALASHGLGDTERDRLEADLRRAHEQSDALGARVEALEDEGATDRAFVDETYSVVMAGRLKGARVAVLFVGSVDGDIRSAITGALRDADAGAPLRIRAVKVPVDDVALNRRLENRPFLAAYAGKDQLESLGHALGQEFITGTDTPLWNALQTLIVEESVGAPGRPADGVVVVRTAAAQTGATALFLKGLYSGIRDAGVPAIGVERTQDGESAMERFQKAGLSTVDAIDTRAGKLALVILLSEPAVTGNFGTKPTAHDGLLPRVLPVQTTTGG
jgi:Copper transport outer membrane protein, MctB